MRIKRQRIIGLNTPPQAKDIVIDGQDRVMIPGLINAHDHLELNNFQRLKYRSCYTHSRQWIEDIEARFETDPALVQPRQQPLQDRLLIGALKNLLCGVTTVCHHNPLHRPLRSSSYPIRVLKRYGFCHSLLRGEDAITTYRRTPAHHPWIIHLAEGIDAEAEAEFEQLVQWGLIQPNTILVHGTGLTAKQRQYLKQHGRGLIWCPGSNIFMFGQTAQIKKLAEAGKVALGSDSRLSGEFDLLAELRVAHQTGQLSPQHLFRLVTVDATNLLWLREGGQGKIEIGGLADLVLLPPSSGENFDIFHLKRSDIELVLIDGQPHYGSPWTQPIFEATRTTSAPIQIDGIKKLLSLKLVKAIQKSRVKESGLKI